MKLRNLKTFGGTAVALLIFFGALLPVSADDGFSKADQERALELVGQLESGDFAERAAAVAELDALPAAALPWLGKMVEATEAKDVDVHLRLKSIVHSVITREEERGLREGTQVKVDLKAAKPGAVLEALKQKVGSSFTSLSSGGIWEAETAEDFSFEGSFWEAVDAMLKAYPPKKGGRENLGGEHDMARWGTHDFGAADNAHVNSGILRIRNGRTALENIGGKDCLVVTLVPSVEPTCQVEELSLLVEGLGIGDGKMIEPEKKFREWKSGVRGVRFHPVGTYTWVFPLERGTDLRGRARLEGIAKVRVRRFNWEEVEMPEDLAGPVEMRPGVKFSVLEREPGQLRVQFEGKGSRPVWAAHYDLRREGFEILDEDGKVLEFSIRRSSSSGSNGWRTSYGGTIKGEPARVRAKLHGGEQAVELKFDLVDLPVPGSTLFE